MPFLLFVGHLYLNFIPNENSNKCLTLNNICRCFKLTLVICSECFFILRTYVLWNRNKVVLGAMLSLMPSPHPTLLLHLIQAVVVAFGSILFSTNTSAPYETSPIPGITGCYQSSGSVELFLPFVLLFALEFGLFSLTLIRVIHSWRSTNNCLFVILSKHSIFYYACGLLFSAANILMSLLLHDAYNSMFEDLQIVILAILATCMHLRLWHIDQHIHDSDSLMHIPLSDASPAGLLVYSTPFME